MTAVSDIKLSAHFEFVDTPVAAAKAHGFGAAPARGGPPGSADDATDEALIGRVAQGDRQALRLLYGRHQLKIFHFAVRLTGNRATAEDVVSEVFIELWRRAASFEGRARLSTWLLAIARNKAVSILRGRTEEPLDDAMAAAIPDGTGSAEEILDAGKRSAVLQRCLAQLSGAHREIIDLAYYHGRSVEEVATIVGIPAATVKTRMFYARRQLAEHLRAAGIETVCA
jgi:RNA polymerase sigma-70 factor (ECF subfamily)